METFYASSAAEEAWRLNHCRAQCNNIVAIGHFDGTGDIFNAEHPEIHTAVTTAMTVRDNAKELQLISLYEQRSHRLFQRHLNDLERLQAERKAKRLADLEDARLLSQLAELKNLPYDPAADGFVFSNQEIDRYTERHYRLRLARQSDFRYWKERSGHWELPKAA
jgi:hypothetical protein